MKNKPLLLVFLAAFPCLIHSQSLLFSRTFGSERYDDARSIIATNDGGYLFTGLSMSDTDTLGDLYLTQTNAAGAKMWSKSYGRQEEDGGNSILKTPDGGYVVVGHTALSYGEKCDGYLVKTDAAGNEIWRTVIGTAYDDVCDGGVVLADGSILVTGRTENAQTRRFQVLLARIAPDGSQLSFKQLPSDIPCIGYKMARAADGNYFITGYAEPEVEQVKAAMLMKCTENGEVLWYRTCGASLNSRAYDLIALPDGGCLIVGGSRNAAEEPIQMAAYHFDGSGNLLESNEQLAPAGATGYLYSALYLPDGKIALSGQLCESPGAPVKAVAGILDNTLNVAKWENPGITQNTSSRAMVYDGKGSFVLCGLTMPVKGAPDIFVGSVPVSGATTAYTEVSKVDFLLFPNPMHDIAYLKVGEGDERKSLSLFTLDGKLARTEHFYAEEYFLYRNGLIAGEYFFLVQGENGKSLVSGKLRVE